MNMITGILFKINMETTFYNKTGHPQIYLSTDDDNYFYTWHGHAVAYLYEDQIYGWRGKHIGWYHEGIIYDLKGYRVGSIREKCPYSVYSEYSKYSKYSQYSQYSRHSPYSKPSFRTTYSNTDLIDFIMQNKV